MPPRRAKPQDTEISDNSTQKKPGPGKKRATGGSKGGAAPKQTGAVGTLRRGRSAGQAVSTDAAVAQQGKKAPPEPATTQSAQPNDAESSDHESGIEHMDIDERAVEPRPGTAAATASTAPPPAGHQETGIAASYAQWSAPSGRGQPPAFTVVDKTAQSLKRKSDALQDPSSKKYASLVNNIRQYQAQHASSSPVAQQAPLAPQALVTPQATHTAIPAPAHFPPIRPLPSHRRTHSRSSSGSFPPPSPSPFTDNAVSLFSPFAASRLFTLPRDPFPDPQSIPVPTPPPSLTPSSAPAAPPQTPTRGPREPNVAIGYAAPEAKLAAFTPSSQRCLQDALSRVQARLFVINAFPDVFDMHGFTAAAWRDVMARNGQEPIRLSDAAQDWLLKQQSTVRTRFKSEVLAKVREHYGLSSLAADDLKNRVNLLKDGDVFIYEHTVARRARKEAPAGGTAAAGSTDASAPAPNADDGTDGKKYEGLIGKGRPFTHPAILAVVAALGFDRKSRSKTPQLAVLLPDEFTEGIPYRLYAFACTMIQHALDCAVNECPMNGTKYKSIYQYWVDTVKVLFNPADSKKKAKMDELREHHWETIKTNYQVQLPRADDANASVSRHDEALGTSDEEDD